MNLPCDWRSAFSFFSSLAETARPIGSVAHRFPQGPSRAFAFPSRTDLWQRREIQSAATRLRSASIHPSTRVASTRNARHQTLCGSTIWLSMRRTQRWDQQISLAACSDRSTSPCPPHRDAKLLPFSCPVAPICFSAQLLELVTFSTALTTVHAPLAPLGPTNQL